MTFFLATVSLFSLSVSAAEPFDAKMAAKAAAFVGECDGPGMEPKPKMSEFVNYLWANGLKDAKVECSISNRDEKNPMPMILIHAADGGTYFVNFKRKPKAKRLETGEVILDAKTPEGMKRRVVWPRDAAGSVKAAVK